MPPYYQLMPDYIEMILKMNTEERNAFLIGAGAAFADPEDLPGEAYDANDDFDHSRWL